MLHLRPALHCALLAALVFEAVACGPPPLTPREGARPIPPNATPVARAASSNASRGRDALAPELSRYLDELDALGDPNTMFLALPQTPPKGWRPLPARRPGAFPGVSFSEVRGYSFAFGEDLNLAGECELLAKDGTLCPNVNAPGRTLSPVQAQDLVHVLRSATYWEDDGSGHRVGRIRTRCDFSPHLGFIFFDSVARPVGQVEICFDCGEWLAKPTVEAIGSEPSVMRPSERAAFVKLCNELHLGGCALADREKIAALQAAGSEARATHDGGPSPLARRVLDQDLGIDRSKPLVDVTDDERRSLCTWYVRASSASLQKTGGGYECPGGPSWQGAGYAGCLTSFPKCDATVGRGLDCMRALLGGDVCLKSPASIAACAGAAGCTWGWRPAP